MLQILWHLTANNASDEANILCETGMTSLLEILDNFQSHLLRCRVVESACSVWNQSLNANVLKKIRLTISIKL